MEILIVSPLASHKPSGGAKRRILNMLRALKRRGHSIHFVYTCHESVDVDAATDFMRAEWDSVHVIPFTGEYVKSQGEDYGVDDWFEPGSGETVTRLCHELNIDLAIIQYVFQSKYCDYIPDHIPTVMDMHDKLSRRAMFEANGMEPGFFYTTEADELRGAARADVVLSIQDAEAKYFARSGRPVAVVGHIDTKRFVERRYNRLQKIGYLGAYNKFNIYSLDKALPPVLAALDETGFDTEVHVAGNAVSGMTIEHPRLVRRGFVESIDDFYAEMDLMLNPTLVGTGLKIKTAEALAYGTPIVSTSVGFDGLPAMVPHHEAADEHELARLVAETARGGFGALTKLTNVSRALFSEYQANLSRNLDVLFCDELVELKRSGGDIANFVESRVGPLAEPDHPNYIKLNDVRPKPSPVKLAHIVNPVNLGMGSDLYIAQPITFESMRRSKKLAEDLVDVDLLAVAYPEDSPAMPTEGFKILPDLQESVLDHGAFELPRKLPLLRDLIRAGLDGSDADYLVYTNVDIALTPQFYMRAAELIAEGHDAIIINRRTLPKRHTTLDGLGDMYADNGADHPGYDCFIFKRELAEKFNLGTVSIGVHLIGRVLLWNLMAFSKNMKIILRDHLTFHIGDDVPSKDVRLLDYIEHNCREGLKVLSDLEDRAGLLTELKRDNRRNLMTLNFGPEKFPAPDRGGSGQGLARPIFIHAMFRAGSTYLWRKMRPNKNFRCYYEPLHEDLAMFNKNNLERHMQRHAVSKFHKLDVDDWLFKEYEPLMGSRGGVKGYKRTFAYDDFARDDENPGLKAYVDGLLKSAGDKMPVLQFNRTSMRQDWFKREYPEAFHVYLNRSARSQWASYASFTNGGRMGFLRNTLMIAGKNRDNPRFAPLAEIVPLVRHPDTANMHGLYDHAYNHYSLGELYAVFYYIWLMSLLDAVENADLFVDMERLSRDTIYQLEIEFEMLCRNVNLNLSDAKIPEYAHDCIGFAPGEIEEVEDRVHRVVAQAGFRIPAKALQLRGQSALAAELQKARRRKPVEPPADLDERRAAIRNDMNAALEQFKAGTPKPAGPPLARPPALLVREERESMPPLTPGDRLGISDRGEAAFAVADHWHGAERDLVWSKRGSAALKFCIPAGQAGHIRLDIRAATPQIAAGPVRIRVDNDLVYFGPLDTQFQLLTLPLVARPSGRDDRPVLVTIESGLATAGQRDIGVAIRSIEFEASDTPVELPDSQALVAAFEGRQLLLKHLDPVSPDSNRMLARGWSGAEETGVWSTHRKAIMVFFGEADLDGRALVIEFRAEETLAARGVPVEIRLNRHVLHSGPVEPGWNRMVVTGVAGLVREAARNELHFELGELAEVEGDSRRLGVQVRRVGLDAMDSVDTADAAVVGVEDLAGVALIPLEPRPQEVPLPIDGDVPAEPEPMTGKPAARDSAATEPAEAEEPKADIPESEWDGRLFEIGRDTGARLQVGWSDPEGDFVWAVQNEAVIGFDIATEADTARLAIELATVDELEAEPGNFSVSINGDVVYRGKLEGEWQTLEIDGVASLLRPGMENTLTFRAEHLFQPEDDDRSLSLRFRRAQVGAPARKPNGKAPAAIYESGPVVARLWSGRRTPGPFDDWSGSVTRLGRGVVRVVRDRFQ